MIARIAFLLMTLVVLLTINYSLYVDAQEQINIEESNVVSDVYNRVENSVVGIITPLTEGTSDIFEPVYDGSGFVYDRMENTVHIVTNEHVVQDFETVKVVFNDGSAYTADVIGAERQADIAVVQIVWNETQQPQAPEPIEIGNSSDLEVGEQILVIGNPSLSSGQFRNVLTTGIISRLGVDADAIDQFGVLGTIYDAIVTDAMIAGGNSGGPLLNMEGQVVGMMVSSDGETPCCSYAIPSNRIQNFVPTLVEDGEYIYPYLGIKFVDLSPDLLEQAFDDPPKNLTGVLVTQIDKDSPAHKAGINASITNQFGNVTGGDVITAVDANPITDANDLSINVREQKQVGDTIELTVYRNGDFLHLNATLEAVP